MEKEILIFAEWRDKKGYHAKFFHSMEDYDKAASAPDCKMVRSRKLCGPRGRKVWRKISGSHMSAYHRSKARARDLAIQWQNSDENRSWEDIFAAKLEFTKLAARYGLVNEFKENGII